MFIISMYLHIDKIISIAFWLPIWIVIFISSMLIAELFVLVMIHHESNWSRSIWYCNIVNYLDKVLLRETIIIY